MYLMYVISVMYVMSVYSVCLAASSANVPVR